MEKCPHCNYESNISYPNCPSCGLIKNLRDYNEMKTFLSGGFVFKDGKKTDKFLNCDEFSKLRRQIQGSAT